MERFKTMNKQVLEDWARGFSPAEVTLCDLRTGQQLREVSLVAAQLGTAEQTGKDPYTGEERTVTYTVIERFLTAGEEARAYEDHPNVAVYSPLRDGQIAHCEASVFLFRSLLKKITPKPLLFKPNVCIHVRERITEAEERAMIELGMQAGARHIFLYQEPLSALLRTAPKMRELRRAFAIHIEPRT